ncbi:MAG: class II aldolase/adducin family protein [Alphaproteobacteria bacterium]|nr:class II aldolase/adducin family protein [Alphaproteobacteria bacterium]
MNLQKKNLALSYAILAHLNLDDHTYTHLSARSKDGFYLSEFGNRFSDVTADSLLELDLLGNVLTTPKRDFNITGSVIHSAIYRARPDIHSVFHIHTPAMIAVSALPEGLLPISQWALHFYEQINYHDYESLALTHDNGEPIATDLGNKKILMLRNHGVVICGATLHEAVFYAYHLERACQTQCLTLAMNRDIILPPHDVCVQACNELLNFEKDIGARDWTAWMRALKED